MKDHNNLPQHVAIIMDGNGRWAKSRGLYRINGHEKGADTVRDIITESRKIGIKYLTLYTFSAENWGRDKREVDFLMNLLVKFLDTERSLMQDKDIKFIVSGETDRLPPYAREKVDFTIDKTSENRSMILNLALSYGGKQEILRAVRNIAGDFRNGKISEKELQ